MVMGLSSPMGTSFLGRAIARVDGRLIAGDEDSRYRYCNQYRPCAESWVMARPEIGASFGGLRRRVERRG